MGKFTIGGDLMVASWWSSSALMGGYPLLNIYKKPWTDPPCYQWVNPLFLWQFSIAILNYQGVMLSIYDEYGNSCDEYGNATHISSYEPRTLFGR